MKGTTILVPVALSPSCVWAIQCGANLARHFGVRLVCVHVGPASRSDVESFVRKAAPDISADILLVPDGEPAEVLIQIARDITPLLIVMPTHAHGKFRRFLVGSVTAKVLHDADCPVLTGVHREALPLAASAGFRKMVCAVDRDDSFVRLVTDAREFASHFGASMTTVHAIPSVDETSDNRGEIDVRNYLFKAAETDFEELKRSANVSVDVRLKGGPVATVVRETALDVNADLVVIGRGHTLGGLGRLRTHSYAIIRSSPCPVLSI